MMTDMRAALTVTAFALLLTGCSTPPTVTPSPSLTAPRSAPTASATATPVAPVIDDLAVCEAYLPTADGAFSPLMDEIVSMYASGDVTEDGVRDLYGRLQTWESQASPATLPAVQANNAPIANMHNAIQAGEASFDNQWNATDAALEIFEACDAVGYRY